MDPKRKAWCEKYKVNIVDGGVVDRYLIPEHVEYVAPCSIEGTEGFFIGFDGTRKTWDQLTEEEKQDYQEQLEEAPKRLEEYLRKKDSQQER